ncbi:MAG: alpha/beta hydrolase [Vampirovibrionales bacterium]|nr:alpha/beta hydrolase [Vampirovibrionales bacterium]
MSFQATGALALLLLAPLIAGGFLWFERGALYHPEMAEERDPWKALAGIAIRDRLREVEFETADGKRIHAVYLPAPSASAYTMVFAHGNAGNLANRWAVLQACLEEGYGILAFDYRGYGKSQGKPSEKGLYRDMEAASRYLAAHNTPIERQIALGESLGTGVAVDVATRLPYRAVALYSAYTSIPAVVAHLRQTGQLGLLGRLPVDRIITQRFDSLSKIPRVTCPLLLMQGERDAMMPLAMPQALYDHAGAPYKTTLVIPGAGHNEAFTAGRRAFFDALAALLKASEKQSAQ